MRGLHCQNPRSCLVANTTNCVWSHLWDGDPQTSDAGRFYLDRHGCSFSGTLRPTVPASTLTATDETLDGMVWFFHHDIAQANGGVAATIPFRLYTCSLPAP